MKPKLISVKCIWDHAEHQGMTDLIFYKDHFYCCFREGSNHAGGEDGKIRILQSRDADQWRSVAFLSKEGVDLRDPMLSETPDGQLLLTMGGSIYREKKLISLRSRAAFSQDGTGWTDIIDVAPDMEWLWRPTWFKGAAYAASYRATDINDLKKPFVLTLFSSSDGIDYRSICPMDVSGKPSETTLRFAADGTMIALIRRTITAAMGIAKPPYTDWQYFDLREYLGGPNFLLLPDGQFWATGRIFKKDRSKMRPFTALGKFQFNSFKTSLIFPSGGDTSYPGMVYREGKLYVSYYSSHEGKALIYLAVIDYH